MSLKNMLITNIVLIILSGACLIGVIFCENLMVIKHLIGFQAFILIASVIVNAIFKCKYFNNL